MTPDEARKLDNKKCLIFIRGFDPILDDKYDPFKHPAFSQTADGDGDCYIHCPANNSLKDRKSFELLSPKAVSHFQKLKEKGENVYIDELSLEDFMKLGTEDLKKRFLDMEEKEQKEKIQKEQAKELEFDDSGNSTETAGGTAITKGSRPAISPEEDNIVKRMATWKFSKEQKDELREALKAQMSHEDILTYFYPEVSAETMAEKRNTFLQHKK